MCFRNDFFLIFVLQIGGRHQTMAKEIETLAAFAGYMMRWIDLQATKMKSVGIDREVNVMSGTEFVAALSVDGYGPDRLIELKTMVDYIFNEQIESEWAVDKGKAEDQEPQLSAVTQSVLEGFLMIMDLMLGGNQVHRDDYRAVVVRTVERKQKRTAPVFGLANLVDWDLFIVIAILTAYSFCRKASISSQWTYALNLWCLNPAVVLKEVRESTRSIVVTSGTLSPLASYQSELDIDFKITLEANHVIPANRVWIGSISQGPKNISLNGTFKTTGTFEYQVKLVYSINSMGTRFFSFFFCKGWIGTIGFVGEPDNPSRRFVFLAFVQPIRKVGLSMAGHWIVATSVHVQNYRMRIARLCRLWGYSEKFLLGYIG